MTSGRIQPTQGDGEWAIQCIRSQVVFINTKDKTSRCIQVLCVVDEVYPGVVDEVYPSVMCCRRGVSKYCVL